MEQIKKEPGKSSGDKLSEARKALEQIQSKPIPDLPKFRKVRLRYRVGCGCGNNDYEIERTVPYHSTYKDGDRIISLKKGDMEVGEWKD